MAKLDWVDVDAAFQAADTVTRARVRAVFHPSDDIHIHWSELEAPGQAFVEALLKK